MNTALVQNPSVEELVVPSLAPAAKRRPGLVADLLSLTKPRLSTLVLVTAAGGLWLAPGRLGALRALWVLLATAGTVGAANALNCWLERDSDRFMERTRDRPLPTGRMRPATAVAFGVVLALVSVPALALLANALTGLLGALALLVYVAVYTPLKRKSTAAMLVGAVPGAIPPLMGWTAVTGHIDGGGLALFGVLFLWQLPHFLAIALFRKDEYRRAGLMSVPLRHGDEAARRQVFTYSVLLVAVSVLPFALGLAGGFYLGAALLLGGALVWMALRGLVQRLGAAWARQLFFLSMGYLSALFLALALNGGPLLSS